MCIEQKIIRLAWWVGLPDKPCSMGDGAATYGIFRSCSAPLTFCFGIDAYHWTITGGFMRNANMPWNVHVTHLWYSARQFDLQLA